jgi:chromosomal replication initiator protein
MITTGLEELWAQFLELIQKKCSPAEYQNWLSPIRFRSATEKTLTLEVPNIFVKEYLLDNYKEDLLVLFSSSSKELPIDFVIAAPLEKKIAIAPILPQMPKTTAGNLNSNYTFETFIEGPSNQFVKSAALGVAARPGKSFNPLFIHGGVGLGKTHLLHGIGHEILNTQKKLSVQCITTEAFINDLVDHLRNKSVDKMKRFYRNVDVLLVDDIQFLQNRLNFEEEFCNTFESLIHQNKQIVITSDKPPSQLKLSERMVARMEWGLVAHIGVPELETRVAIIQQKAELKGVKISQNVAFFIADRVYNNVRQLEGVINRLSAYCRLMQVELTEKMVENLLKEMTDHRPPQNKITIESILKNVATVFEIRVSDLKGDSRLKEIALPRQVAMYLAKELMDDSLVKIASSFGGKTHSTLLHAWKKISQELEKNNSLKRQIDLARRNIES